MLRVINSECPICISDLRVPASAENDGSYVGHETAQPVMGGKCGHAFHKSCILRCLKDGPEPEVRVEGELRRHGGNNEKKFIALVDHVAARLFPCLFTLEGDTERQVVSGDKCWECPLCRGVFLEREMIPLTIRPATPDEATIDEVAGRLGVIVEPKEGIPTNKGEAKKGFFGNTFQWMITTLKVIAIVAVILVALVEFIVRSSIMCEFRVDAYALSRFYSLRFSNINALFR